MSNLPSSTMSPKRKRVVLTLKEKSEIVEALDRGESGHSLCDKYGIGKATIYDIKKKGETIRAYSRKMNEEVGTSKRKVMKPSKLEEVEQALFVWFIQNLSAGNPVSGPLLCEKALCFAAALNADPSFKASQGWLEKFKKRHGIRSNEIHGERLSADEPSADKFKTELSAFLKEGGYDDDFVYNADETGLFWKALPSRSLIARNEERVSGPKRRKERVTVMVCANASGTNRIPLYVIGRSKNPRSFKNMKKPPVEYGCQKKAWMNVQLFKDWFVKIFIPEVKKYQSSVGKTGKVLLLIDNAPAHPAAEYLNMIDELVTVKFLPPNVSALIQPMDQGVIEALKRHYRKELLRQLLLPEDNTVQTVASFYKKINLRDCCYMAAQSWNSLTQNTLRNSWNKILPGRRPSVGHASNDADQLMEEITRSLGMISICSECDRPDVERWLACDTEDQGYQVMNDEEIVEFVLNEAADTEEEDGNEMDEAGDFKAEQPLPSNKEAFHYLEEALRWFEAQDECDPQRLVCLKSIRDFAATKRRTAFKQTLITTFFTNP